MRIPFSCIVSGFCAFLFVTQFVSVPDYSKNSVDQLIDALTQIDSQSPGINSAGIYQGFIANNAPGSFQEGVLAVTPPKVPVQMSELVRRGPSALPELISHVQDKRPTKVQVWNRPSGKRVGLDAFMFMYFSDEYDPKIPYWFSEKEQKHEAGPMWRNFQGLYTVKVGDVCYVLIGQIVNRHLLAVRYQPSAGLVVNSPIEAPILGKRLEETGVARTQKPFVNRCYRTFTPRIIQSKSAEQNTRKGLSTQRWNG